MREVFVDTGGWVALKHKGDALWRAAQRLNEVVTWISQWIDLAYTSAGEGTGTDLAEYMNNRRRA